jgi:hypothetical protein
MAELIPTPIDDLTNLPLPIFMRGDDFRPKKGRSGPSTPNYHHHFHPQHSPLLGYETITKKFSETNPLRLEGLAVRFSRGQYTPQWLHDRYHKIFSGPELPETSKDKFTAVVLACAGVVPRTAINLNESGEYSEISLTDKQHEFIRRRLFYEGAIERPKYQDRKGEIGRFIATYAIENTLDELLSEKQIQQKVEEFLIPKDDIMRQEAGKFLLEHAVDASVADLIPMHQEAKKEKMAKPTHKQLGDLMLKYFTPYRFPDYFIPLEDKLNIVYG